MMIGKPITGQELTDLLAEEDHMRGLREDLMGELATLKSGECLLYEAKEGTESLLSLSLSLSPVKDLTVIQRPGKVYVYKGDKK